MRSHLIFFSSTAYGQPVERDCTINCRNTYLLGDGRVGKDILVIVGLALGLAITATRPVTAGRAKSRARTATLFSITGRETAAKRSGAAVSRSVLMLWLCVVPLLLT
jgi:hypothetical protein